ncbi:MAG: hypothetical protein ACTS5F_00485 [Candidatus Hodgkinia cicadicola]
MIIVVNFKSISRLVELSANFAETQVEVLITRDLRLYAKVIELYHLQLNVFRIVELSSKLLKRPLDVLNHVAIAQSKPVLVFA